MEKEGITIGITQMSGGAIYTITPYLRYAKRKIAVSEAAILEEYRLQQMWQGSDGSQEWIWIETVEL